MPPRPSVHRSPPRTTRTVVVVVLGAVALALAAGLLHLAGRRAPYDGGGGGTTGAVAVADTGRAEVAALAVLRAWDAERARAYASGSPVDLRRLYTPGSVAGEADVRVLRRYRERGLRVEGLRVQVLDVEVLSRGATRWVLRVTDRVADAVAVRDGARWPLPRDAATTRTVELRRVEDRWLVGEVRLR